MTKAEIIERHGIEYYEQYKVREKIRTNDRYHNDPEYRESHKARNNAQVKTRYQNDPEYRESRKAYKKEYYQNNPEYDREYKKNDLNSVGKPKCIIRRQSSRILFDKRHHSRLKGYEIHHCFGYDDPNKFIYIPKTLHNAIHQYLRYHQIDVDSNHYDYIKYMINECEEYTYISI